jgi:hypothetical protein
VNDLGLKHVTFDPALGHLKTLDHTPWAKVAGVNLKKGFISVTLGNGSRLQFALKNPAYGSFRQTVDTFFQNERAINSMQRQIDPELGLVRGRFQRNNNDMRLPSTDAADVRKISSVSGNSYTTSVSSSQQHFMHSNHHNNAMMMVMVSLIPLSLS